MRSVRLSKKKNDRRKKPKKKKKKKNMKANNVKYMLYEGSRSAADALCRSIDTRWKVMAGSTQIRALLSCISIRDEAEAKMTREKINIYTKCKIERKRKRKRKRKVKRWK